MSINMQGYLDTIRAPWGQLFYDLVWDQLPIAGQRVLDFGSGCSSWRKPRRRYPPSGRRRSSIMYS